MSIDKTFSDKIYEFVNKKLPSKAESTLFNAILVICIDHGKETRSTKAAIEAKGSINQRLAAGLLDQNESHGGATQLAMQIYLKEDTNIVQEYINQGKRIPGYGHRIYKEEDPRVTILTNLCKELNYTSKYIDLAFEIEKEIKNAKGKKFPLNIDGMIGAIFLEMGFNPEQGWGLFMVSRLPGMLSHATNPN